MADQTIRGQQKEKLSSWCKQIAGSRKIVGACLFGARIAGYGNEKSNLNVLLIVRNYPSRLMVYPKFLDDVNAFFLVVDKGLFEADVEQGIIGELIAEKLMLPYQPIVSPEYLQQQELKLKKRAVWELLETLVLEYPEMSHEFTINPLYFMYENMTRKARLYPLLTYSFLNVLRRPLKKQNTKLIMKGYLEAIEALAKEGWVSFKEDYVKINKVFIENVKKRRIRLHALFRTIQRGLLTHVLRAFPGVIQPILEDQELFLRTHRQIAEEKLMFQLDASENYLLVPTPNGLVSLSDATNIEDYIYNFVQKGKQIKIEHLGGVLNMVFLVTYEKNGESQRIVVKKFKDWFAFKWFPLAFWTLGTHSFAVLGQTRLEREYAISQFLNKEGFRVPKILHISPQQRLIFKEYIEGTNMTKIIKQIVSSKEKAQNELALIQKAGETIAKAHTLDIALGDCKPENIIVTKGGEVVFLDLEQATRDGNKPWDVAEFLYYSGHYISPIANTNVAELITQNFIEGYLRGGGKKEIIKKAWSAQYTKVFSIFTPPQVIFTISNICRRIDNQSHN
jgi:tRNA A-37 threonylcarbamoyl transferase component Bud32